MRRPNRGRAMPRSPREVHVFGAVASPFEKLPLPFGHAERVAPAGAPHADCAGARERLVLVTQDRKLAPSAADILCA